VKRVGHAGERFAGFFRKLIEDGLWIAEPDRVRTARVEVVGAAGFLGYSRYFF
jgi:hypothetical protein